MHRQPADLRQPDRDQLGVAGRAVEPGADGGGAERDRQQLVGGGVEVVGGLPAHERVGAELLAQRHGHGVLQFRAAHLQDPGELRGLGGQRAPQVAQRAGRVPGRQVHGQLDRGGEHVVGRLRAVDVVVGVQPGVVALGEPEAFQGPVGHDLVGVHVGRGAGAALHHVDHELVAEGAVQHVVTGADDRIAVDRVQLTELGVRQRGGLLHVHQGVDEVAEVRQGHPRDREVLQRPQGLHPVVGVEGHVAGTEGVVLDPGALEDRDRRPLPGELLGHLGDPPAQPAGHPGDRPVEHAEVVAADPLEVGGGHDPQDDPRPVRAPTVCRSSPSSSPSPSVAPTPRCPTIRVSP